MIITVIVRIIIVIAFIIIVVVIIISVTTTTKSNNHSDKLDITTEKCTKTKFLQYVGKRLKNKKKAQYILKSIYFTIAMDDYATFGKFYGLKSLIERRPRYQLSSWNMVVHMQLLKAKRCKMVNDTVHISVTLMAVNSFSVSLSTKVQVLFTGAKLLALCIIVVGGIVKLIQGELCVLSQSCIIMFNRSFTKVRCP